MEVSSGPRPEDTRDRIINSYRDEIKNHQVRERDFQVLQQVILDLTRRIRGLEGETQHCQRDHEDRLKDQSKVIGNLQGDLDSVKKAIHDRGDEGIHVYEQIQNVKRQVDEKCTEIMHANADLENVRCHNDQLRREIEQLHHETNHSHEVRKRQQQA